MSEEELNSLKKKAYAFDWLMEGRRGEKVLFRVLDDYERELAETTEQCIFTAMEIE